MAKVDPEMRSSFWADMPEVPEGLEFFYRAFHDLSPSRQVGFGAIGGIPFESIDRYAERYGVEDFEEFHGLIRAMDSKYIVHHAPGPKTKRPPKS